MTFVDLFSIQQDLEAAKTALNIATRVAHTHPSETVSLVCSRHPSGTTPHVMDASRHCSICHVPVRVSGMSVLTDISYKPTPLGPDPIYVEGCSDCVVRVREKLVAVGILVEVRDAGVATVGATHMDRVCAGIIDRMPGTARMVTHTPASKYVRFDGRITPDESVLSPCTGCGRITRFRWMHALVDEVNDGSVYATCCTDCMNLLRGRLGFAGIIVNTED